MKKLLTGFTIVFIAMVTLMPLARAQKASFTGTAVFDVKVEGEIPEQAKAMMPTEMTFKLTADKQSMSMNFGMMEQKTIYNATTQDAQSMMSVMGQKFVIKLAAAQINEQRVKEGETFSVKPTTETKVIAGYTCKKSVVTKKAKDGTTIDMDVYFTDDIDVSSFKFSNTFPEITGFPLEYTMKSGPMSFKMSARSIKKENIPASEFVIPTDYKQVTTEELKTMFGGGGEQ